MPCISPPDHYPTDKSRIEELKKDIDDIKYYDRRNQKIADELTRMLCSICRKLEKQNNLKVLTPSQLKWFEKHKEWDEACKLQRKKEKESKC